MPTVDRQPEASRPVWVELGALIGLLLLVFVFAFDRCGDRACLDATLNAVVRILAALVGFALVLPAMIEFAPPLRRYSGSARRIAMTGYILLPALLLILYADVARSD